MSAIVAIVGRPNVGKSTFFNRLIQRREAIVDAVSGVTRDRHYGRSDWNGKEFSVIDTGGYILGSDDVFEAEIDKQVILAIEEADAIIFMVDVESGITGMDEDVANLLRRQEKPVLLAVNKVDNSKRLENAVEFYNLGLGEFYPIASTSGSGTGELLDALIEMLPEVEDEEESELPRFAVVGRPNVGKSSLVNALMGEDRNIVTSIAGTTRDSLFTRYTNFGYDMLLVDTAGIRKKTKVKENVEFYSTIRAIRSIEESEVVLLMIDAQNGFESQDQAIFNIARRNHKGIVIMVNKWDLIEKDQNTILAYTESIKEQIAPFTDVPIIFTSVLDKKRILKALDFANDVYKRRVTKIATSKLNDILQPIIEHNPPPAIRGRYIHIKYFE